MVNIVETLIGLALAHARKESIIGPRVLYYVRSSTEILIWEESKMWMKGKNLPLPLNAFSAATLDNIVYVFGRY